MQANHSRLTDCINGCGRQIPYKFSPRVCCDHCRDDRRRERDRLVAEKKRRAKGIPQCKGVDAICTRCSSTYEQRSVRNKYCKTCRPIVNLEKANLRSQKKRSTEEGRQKINAWTRQANAKNPTRRVSAHMTVLMHRALDGKKQGRSWRTFVDYSLQDLITHIERQFLPGMTWENKGEWHIDHIVPRSSFKYDSPDDPEFKACWALTNLRPMWARENIRKNAKRLHLL